MTESRTSESGSEALRVRAVIEGLVGEPKAAGLLTAYYKPNGPFAGATFETLGDNDPNAFGRDDLLATTLLDVSLPPDSVRAVLGESAGSLSSGLRRLGPDEPLWVATEEKLHNAGEVWNELRRLRGVDWVIAGKLLARKRPKLVPVVDRWTVKVLQPPKGQVWASLKGALSDDGLRNRLEAIRPDASSEVPILRLLDALLWMRHSESKNARAVRRDLGLPVSER